ncbi:hypothetical protein AALO_G00257960 [Alosa alosa]|uniref:Uncharacterized protein n=1 Tax=Alosa alosa TaxID=278164 RepID=A0AAV6FSN2_9TELE|nr:hypothetical protein AALO_G00257960 [Alosa alosa]
MPDNNSSMQVLIHQVSKRRTQNPFSRNKGQVQCVAFHPVRPFFFVATQRYVRVYNLIKQELSKKLAANCKWISSIAIHPGGECPQQQAQNMVPLSGIQVDYEDGGSVVAKEMG